MRLESYFQADESGKSKLMHFFHSSNFSHNRIVKKDSKTYIE